MRPLESINPATGEKIAEYPQMTDTDIQQVLDKVDMAQRSWQHTDWEQRSRLMHRAADILLERKEQYAQLITEEMGKIISEARSEVEKCAWVCRYYADNASHFLRPERVATDARLSYITFQPLGVILAIMPWNFPFWQVFRFAAPGLMAGNAGVLKHAGNVTGCALAIEEVFRDAGFPPWLFAHIRAAGSRASNWIQSPQIKGVTLTGSDPAGRAVAEQAGRHLKKTVLELGGSDAYVILEDADLDHAVETCVAGRLLNAGQSCIGAKRFIAVASVYDAFLTRFGEAMLQATVGDPLNPTNRLGSMARLDLREELQDQVNATLKAGGKCILGGKIPEGLGAFYPPTILTDIPKDSPAFSEELFGPVAAVFKAKDEKEAIALANSTDFGLGAAVFTQDLERGERIARDELEAGSCFVNAFVKSDPRLPFGGIKTSGYGRELSRYGILEFTNIKTVYIAG
jgi:succinate-semialdehyde dehydrogenase/glutarate-semialdehyde dehydrogenase